MKNAVIVHGKPDREEYYDPNSFAPRYDLWKREFERFDVGPETLLVGHSCGGGFLVRWISEYKKARVGRVVLVAPWMNPDNNLASDTADFFDFEIDSDLTSRTQGLTIFNSDTDHDTVQKAVEILKESFTDTNTGNFTTTVISVLRTCRLNFQNCLKSCYPRSI